MNPFMEEHEMEEACEDCGYLLSECECDFEDEEFDDEDEDFERKYTICPHCGNDNVMLMPDLTYQCEACGEDFE